VRAADGALAGDLDDLGGVGEAEVVDTDDFEGAVLDTAVATVTGAIQHGNTVPGQAGAARQQGRLVGLDDKQVVGLLVGDQELGSLRVGLQRVGGDHRPGQVEWGQQWLEGGDVLGRAADLALGQHRAAGVVHRRQQVHRAAVAARRLGAGATQGLAVDGDRPPAAGCGLGRSRSASQAPMAPASASASRRARGRRMVASAGTAKWSGASRRAPSAARTGWGASAAQSAIAAIDRRRPGPRRRPWPGWRPGVAAATGGSRIRDGGQVGQQVRGFRVLELAGLGAGEVGGWDQG
jgi:hypothetical protein